MKSSVSESIRKRLFQFRTAQPFFSPGPAENFAFGATLDGVDSDAELFELVSAYEKFGV